MDTNGTKMIPEMTVVFLGHVDHGKSTLIGRLLYDTRQVPSDRIEFARARSEEQGRGLEFAFLLDGLEEEQAQGITIDFTQTRFSTPNRNFILADAPGHREFLKNMLSGASRAEAAVLLIDAAEGVREQSRRHGYLLTLLGVRQLAVVINKMDMVSWDEATYRSIVNEYESFLASIGFSAQVFIPAAAYTGDNITERSPHMPWYNGPTVLEQLERFQSIDKKDLPLRLPVQDIYRFGARRLLGGRIETGTISQGQSITVWPTREQTIIKTIERWPEASSSIAVQGQNVAVEFADPLFAERGMVITTTERPPFVSRAFHARVVWLGRQPLVPGLRYKIKLGFQETGAWVERLSRVIDIGNLKDVGEQHIPAGFVGEVTIMTDQPLVFDNFADNPGMGRFVLVDGYQITGGGIITGVAEQVQKDGFARDNQKLLFPTSGPVTREDREKRNEHRGGVLWFTGLSGSGKSTLAQKLEERLFQQGYQIYVLDGDNIRTGLNRDLGFSPNDRKENIRRIAQVARLFVDAGMMVITAFISPYNEDRANARALFEDGDFTEVYVKCPLATCEQRDVKGLYKKARSKEVHHFTGLDDSYEEPTNPEIIVETDKMSVDECVDIILTFLSGKQ
jgi:bifunctional enzyme CysN/CysC